RLLCGVMLRHRCRRVVRDGFPAVLRLLDNRGVFQHPHRSLHVVPLRRGALVRCTHLLMCRGIDLVSVVAAIERANSKNPEQALGTPPISILWTGVRALLVSLALDPACP